MSLRQPGDKPQGRRYEVCDLPERVLRGAQHQALPLSQRPILREDDPEPPTGLVDFPDEFMHFGDWKRREEQIRRHAEWQERQRVRNVTMETQLDPSDDLLQSWDESRYPRGQDRETSASPVTSDVNTSEDRSLGDTFPSVPQVDDDATIGPTVERSNDAEAYDFADLAVVQHQIGACQSVRDTATESLPPLTIYTNAEGSCEHRCKKDLLSPRARLTPAKDCFNNNGQCRREARATRFVKCSQCGSHFCAYCNRKCGTHNRRTERASHGKTAQLGKAEVEKNWVPLKPDQER